MVQGAERLNLNSRNETFCYILSLVMGAEILSCFGRRERAKLPMEHFLAPRCRRFMVESKDILMSMIRVTII